MSGAGATSAAEVLASGDLDARRIPDWRVSDAFRPVRTPGLSELTDDVRAEIIHLFNAHGLVLIDVAEEAVDSHSLRSFARILGLGEPYTLPQYRKNSGFTDTGISRMRTSAPAATRAGKPGVLHPSFHSTSGQSLHCDGTLEPIGRVPTTILACHEPAASGGATTFLNITQALHELAHTDPAAANALLADDILLRTGNIKGVEGSCRGHAFAVVDGELISRASFSSTDTWSLSGDETGRDRARGISRLLGHVDDADSLFVRIRAERNQLILFANDKLAHGRDDYVNTPEQVRDMSRALFTRRPNGGGMGATRSAR